MKQDSTVDNKKERDLVFYIKVQFRCNSTMQGTLQWMDGKKTAAFRSVLELGSLIKDAKQLSTGIINQTEFYEKWEDRESVS